MKKHIPCQPWTKDEVIEAIKERACRHLSMNTSKTQRDYPSLCSAAYRLFGTWRKACQSGGIGIKLLLGCQVKWSKEKITIALRRFHQKHPHTSIFSKELSKRHNYLWGIARYYFPNPNTLRKEIGLPQIHIRCWSSEKVIEYLQERVRHKQAINTMTILKENRFLYRASRTYFGSYRKAVEAAGFEFEQIRHPVGRPQIL